MCMEAALGQPRPNLGIGNSSRSEVNFKTAQCHALKGLGPIIHPSSRCTMFMGTWNNELTTNQGTRRRHCNQHQHTAQGQSVKAELQHAYSTVLQRPICTSRNPDTTRLQSPMTSHRSGVRYIKQTFINSQSALLKITKLSRDGSQDMPLFQ